MIQTLQPLIVSDMVPGAHLMTRYIIYSLPHFLLTTGPLSNDYGNWHTQITIIGIDLRTLVLDLQKATIVYNPFSVCVYRGVQIMQLTCL